LLCAIAPELNHWYSNIIVSSAFILFCSTMLYINHYSVTVLSLIQPVFSYRLSMNQAEAPAAYINWCHALMNIIIFIRACWYLEIYTCSSLNTVLNTFERE
jgi:hypothetical protein